MTPATSDQSTTFAPGELETFFTDVDRRIKEGVYSSPLMIKLMGRVMVGSLLNEATRDKSMAEVLESMSAKAVRQMQDTIRASGVENIPSTDAIQLMAATAMDYAPNNDV